MKITTCELQGIKIFEPISYDDERGYFYELYNDVYKRELGCELVQDNVSLSYQGVLRGLHYQIINPQGKLVSVLRGMVYDVAVDMREKSPTFGQYFGTILSYKNKKQMWIPPGFAHGFLALDTENIFHYKCSDSYNPIGERTLKWNDDHVGIKWPNNIDTINISDKDSSGLSFSELYKRFDIF